MKKNETIKKIEKLFLGSTNENHPRKQGRVIELPCFVGDKIYFFLDGKLVEEEVEEIVYSCEAENFGIFRRERVYTRSKAFDFSDFGKTVFLTREAGEITQKEGRKDAEAWGNMFKDCTLPDEVEIFGEKLKVEEKRMDSSQHKFTQEELDVERAYLLLGKCLELFRRQDEHGFVLNLLEEIVHYDDCDCDGHFLMEDIAELLEPEKEREQK